MKIFETIGLVIDFLSYLKNRNKYNDEKIKEDLELLKAIKENNPIKIAEIWKKNKYYVKK